jgi:hypothetical protein
MSALPDLISTRWAAKPALQKFCPVIELLHLNLQVPGKSLILTPFSL